MIAPRGAWAARSIDERVIFLAGAPRSGTTLLARLLAGHPLIHTRGEAHLMTPLAHLGLYDRVDRAPYDPIRSARAARDFVNALPGGEDDYLDALRAYAGALYGRALSGQAAPLFLDKTPAYALILPFISRVFPRAPRLLIARHPCAIWDSYARSFFGGDYRAAHAFNPILERYIPAMAAALRGPEPPLCVRYEDLVAAPEPALRRIYAHLGVPHAPETVAYAPGEGGDPLTVDRRRRPQTDSIARWARAAAADPELERSLRALIARLDPRDLEALGYPIEALFAPLTAAGRPERRRWSRYGARRRALLWARRGVQIRWVRRGVRAVRDGCDVLLRGGPEGGWGREADRRFGEREEV